MHTSEIEQRNWFNVLIFTDNAEEEVLGKLLPPEDQDEEEMLEMAIAMSLEVEEELEEPFPIKSEFLKKATRVDQQQPNGV